MCNGVFFFLAFSCDGWGAFLFCVIWETKIGVFGITTGKDSFFFFCTYLLLGQGARFLDAGFSFPAANICTSITLVPSYIFWTHAVWLLYLVSDVI